MSNATALAVAPAIRVVTPEKKRSADDLLFSVIKRLLRHEHDDQTEEEHDVSESVLDCVEALCTHYDPVSADEELQSQAGRILYLLDSAGERGCDLYSLVLAMDGLRLQHIFNIIRHLQFCGCDIRPRLAYERNLELVFVLKNGILSPRAVDDDE
jgi:hypothetical protein